MCAGAASLQHCSIDLAKFEACRWGLGSWEQIASHRNMAVFASVAIDPKPAVSRAATLRCSEALT